MPSLREIRRKIKSVRSTQQITKAMKMVAAARLRRAQSAILASRPFAARMEEAVRDLALLEVAADVRAGREVGVHPFFDLRPEGRDCLVVVSADKGLCGAFNSNVVRAAVEWLRRRSGKPAIVAVAGKKAREALRRVRNAGIEFGPELLGIFPKVSYAHAELLGKAVIDAYGSGCSSVDVIHNEFRSVAVQRVVTARLLPIPVPQEASAVTTQLPPTENSPPRGGRIPAALPHGEGGGCVEGGPEQLPSANVQGFKFEPERERLLSALLPRFIKARLYRILLESQAAELAARMNAMDAASKNAGELIDSLTLGLNRTRQGVITREIAELVGGAEALAASS